MADELSVIAAIPNGALIRFIDADTDLVSAEKPPVAGKFITGCETAVRYNSLYCSSKTCLGRRVVLARKRLWVPAVPTRNRTYATI